ncbi:LOW QUALITY PROTEIN: uncharacterized protein [Chelonus insularis]|uniref:LOW QUALITY PROTEIN: uncharacterized protein n=1 Tax=Chelonus insularis TaxID=460826 RepID=UPI00158A41EF|nr:LOW QUALITY PROTEIN: uncharacterized protein LOC118065818 [Chelonus insularis]
MEVTKIHEKHEELLDNVESSLKNSSLYDNGIETLEKVQNTSTMLAKCHSTQTEEKELKIEDVNNEESRIERDSLEKETKETGLVKATVKNQTSLAFTIDFGDNKEVESTRFQNLFQKINARHKRNLSTSKIEIKPKKPVADLSPNFVQKPKPLSFHSEGYFSSEDDTKRKAEALSQKLKELGLRSTKGATKKADVISKSLTENSNGEKRRSYHEELPNNFIHEMTYSATMNDLDKVQNNLEEERNHVQYSPEKKYTKNIEYIEINHDYEEEVKKSHSNTTEKLSNTSYLSDHGESNELVSDKGKQSSSHIMSVSGTGELNTDLDRNLDIFNVSGIDGASDETVSEAGTYTIHKDYTDEEKARMDIDKTFSVGVLTEEESNEGYVHHFKMRSSKDTNTWISEWATQVAEHNSLPPIIGGTKGRTPPMSPSKIPSPMYSPRYQKTSESRRSRYEQSDSSLDADIQQMRDRIGNTIHPNTLIDSGGESDEDTSNSYTTPPHSSQRTPTHSALVRRGSLSESLFKRANYNDSRRSMRKYPDTKKKEEILDVPKSPSHVLARLHLQRGNSLDRKSDTAESNSSRRSSLKNYSEENFKHTNSPILNRLKPSTPKLTNSPILGHKTLKNKILNSPSFEKPKQLIQSNSSAKNIGYFTCVENSPYMLRKSRSTSNYQENTSTGQEFSVLNSNPVVPKNICIQRSSSNTSIRNVKTKSLLSRRSSFNDHGDKIPKAKQIVSDSSSETGDQNSQVPVISSGIKLNRAFSIRRARVVCDSDTTPNTTPEERRRKAQMEIKSAPSSARQPNHYRGRTSSVGANNRESLKKSETRPRVPSLSRNEGGRYSMRGPKTSSTSMPRPNVNKNDKEMSKESKNTGRSNSTLTSKEIEFQNWKRRKNYDPMKAAAEGKKKLDGLRKHHTVEDGSNNRDNSVLRSASFHGTHGTLSLTDDWSDNDLNYGEEKEVIQIPPPCSPLGSDSDLDTSSYLQTTQNVMSAMSARITVYQPVSVDSGGESDDDTSHSLRQSNKMIHEVSDTESSDDHQPIQSSVGSRFNKAFELKKGRDHREIKSAPATSRISTTHSRSKSETSGVARTDSGRFSMRMSKGSSNSTKNKPKDVKKQAQSAMKEQEMLNWKRRKSYDPMKAALEGKRKAGLMKKNLSSESSSVLRSQSFHGPVNFGISEWSDEDISASADEAPVY